MNTTRGHKRQELPPEEVDRVVTSQADDDSAWDSPVEVKRGKAGSFSIPPELAERAAFLARLHRAGGLQEWLTRVIRERVELEEGAYAEAKREIRSKGEGRTPA